jgi:hypothetical protein
VGIIHHKNLAIASDAASAPSATGTQGLPYSVTRLQPPRLRLLAASTRAALLLLRKIGNHHVILSEAKNLSHIEILRFAQDDKAGFRNRNYLLPLSLTFAFTFSSSSPNSPLAFSIFSGSLSLIVSTAFSMRPRTLPLAT